jgi:hypothetical protein
MNWNQYIGRLSSTYLNGIKYDLKRRKRDGLEDVKFENFRYHCVWGYVTIVQFLNLARQNGNHNYHYVQVTILHFQKQIFVRFGRLNGMYIPLTLPLCTKILPFS